MHGAYSNNTNPARLFMSNNRSVIETLELGGAYDDPLDLTNTLKSFEYHMGDKQTNKLILELINPSQQIENRLFASYAAANPRGSDPNGVYAAASGPAELLTALEDKVYYVRWGYEALGDGIDNFPALSHMHRVELINMHYSFSEKKERVFKLEFVDSFTKAILSDTFMNIPRTFKIPVNSFDTWRSPSSVIQELILQMLLNVEGYLGLSKTSAIQDDLIDSSFSKTIDSSVRGIAGNMGDMHSENANIVSISNASGFTIPDTPYSSPMFGTLPGDAMRFTLWSSEWRDETGDPQYANSAQITSVVDGARERVAVGSAIRAVQGVKTFYASLGLPLEVPSGYNLDSVRIDPRTGAASFAEPGKPQVPFEFISTQQVGGHSEGGLTYSELNDGIENNPWLAASVESSVLMADDLKLQLTVPPSAKVDQFPRRNPTVAATYDPGPPPGYTYPPKFAGGTVDFWADAYATSSGAAYMAIRRPTGGLTTYLSQNDLEQILVDGTVSILYSAGFTTADYNDASKSPAYFVWEGVNDPRNSISYPLSDVDRSLIEHQITVLVAKKEEFVEQQGFDPSQPTSSVEYIENTNLASLGGALADAGTVPEDPSALTIAAAHGTFDIDDRDNPYQTPYEYRYNLRCNVEANELFIAINKLLENINKRFFKNADKYLQFVKIENSNIPIASRDSFELALGVNVSEENWESKDGFLILSTQSFIKKLYESISDGTITSFPDTDLTDPELELDRTISLAVGYEDRSDNIITDFQWTYPVSHLLYGLRHTPVAVSKVVNVATRWAMMSRSATTGTGAGSTCAITQVIRLAFQLNLDNNYHARSGFSSAPAGSPLALTLTSPAASDVKSEGNDSFFGITASTPVRTGPESTDTSLRAQDVVFSDAVLRAAQAQLVKMSRVDLEGLQLLDSAGMLIAPEYQEAARDALLEDIRLVFRYNLVSVFFPTLDAEDTSLVKTEYWVDGMLLNAKVPTFRKVNRTPLSAFTSMGDPNELSEATRELISGKLEWLNTFSKTIINAKASVLGIPEMDLIGDEIFNRNILVDVNEPRSPGEQHWLTGVYNPRDIVHRIDPKGGYIMDMTLVRSGKDTNSYMEKLRAARVGHEI